MMILLQATPHVQSKWSQDFEQAQLGCNSSTGVFFVVQISSLEGPFRLKWGKCQLKRIHLTASWKASPWDLKRGGGGTTGGLGLRVEKPSVWAIEFQEFSTIQGKPLPSLFVSFAPKLYKSYNYAHAPGPLPARTCAQAQVPGPTPSAPKTVEV